MPALGHSARRFAHLSHRLCKLETGPARSYSRSPACRSHQNAEHLALTGQCLLTGRNRPPQTTPSTPADTNTTHR